MDRVKLAKVAGFLMALPSQKFNFAEFAYEGGLPMLEALAKGAEYCGTVGCAVGWLPAIFPDEAVWHYTAGPLAARPFVECIRTHRRGFEAAQDILDIDFRVSQYLFYPGGVRVGTSNAYSNNLTIDAEPQDVAEHILDFLQRND